MARFNGRVQMPRFIMGMVVGATVVGVPLSAASMTMAKGAFAVSAAGLKYDPSAACVKPVRMEILRQADRDAHLRKVTEYFTCLKDVTSGDVNYATEVMLDGLQQALDEQL
jgi:hypothetical protein